MSRRILQFGTSRFLQAHADLFVHEARIAGQDIVPEKRKPGMPWLVCSRTHRLQTPKGLTKSR